MNINDLHPNPRNPRFIKTERFKALVKSIKDFSVMLSARPIVHDEDGMILGGEMRWRALLEAGKEEIPQGWTYCIKGLTAKEKERFTIVDNVAFGEWSKQDLGNFDETELLGWGMTDWELGIADFDPGDLDKEEVESGSSGKKPRMAKCPECGAVFDQRQNRADNE